MNTVVVWVLLSLGNLYSPPTIVGKFQNEIGCNEISAILNKDASQRLAPMTICVKSTSSRSN